MLTAARSMQQAAGAPALPEVPALRALYAQGFVPREGQILLVAGQPGSLKSMFAQWFVDCLDLPTLYFCADSDAHTAISRLAAKRTGFTTESVIEAFDNPFAAPYFEDAIADSKIQFVFDAGPTLDDMADELDAYVELWDTYPKIVLVDNLVNVESENGEEFAGIRYVMKELHRLARETGAAVIILHHCREMSDPLNPQPRSEIQGKVAQLPERILTVAYDGNEGCFKLSPVKNRGGKQDPTGKMFVRLGADPASASFSVWTGVTYRGGQS